MANYLSTQAAKFYNSVSVADSGGAIKPRIENQPKSFESGGSIIGLRFDWTIDASASATEIVYGPIIKAGWSVVPEFSTLFTTFDAGTSILLDVGYRAINTQTSSITADPDAYADGINISSVGAVPFTSGTAPLATTAPFKLTEDVVLTITYSTANTPSAVKVNGVIACIA